MLGARLLWILDLGYTGIHRTDTVYSSMRRANMRTGRTHTLDHV